MNLLAVHVSAKPQMLRLKVYLRYNCMFAYPVLLHTNVAGKYPDVLLKDTSGLALTCGLV